MSEPKGTSRGFTLVELLVAMIMLVIVGSGLYGTLTTLQRVSTKQAEVSNLQGNLRTGMQLVQSELQELFTNAGTSNSDLVSLSDTLLRYHAMRGLGETCEVTTSGVKIQSVSWNGSVPKSGQHLLLLWDKDSTLASDDVWLELTPTGGPSLAALCPDGVTAAYSVPVTLTVAQRDSIYPPSPVRTLDDMEMGLVASGGQNWLGIRSFTAAEPELIPVIGPLAAGGLTFEYRDAAGNLTGAPENVKSILVTLRGISDRTVATGLGSTQGNPTDSVQVRIQLRNSR
ncbi:MAG TPA: type II secretion system protein [Gemmatimonadales bacterium]|nr:type II secretion system protein [Gemmatimonadales bacterium]